jgi:hypothetical protein
MPPLSAIIFCFPHRMRPNLKRGFNRLFVVLIPVWVIYCLLWYPMQQRARAARMERTEFLHCWQESKPADFKGCADYARLKAGADMWSLKAFYTRESRFLAVVVVVVPLLAYVLGRLLIAMSLWVGRGFMSSS